MSSTVPNALSLRDVHKRFGALRALDGLDLVVPRGSITGLVGPNGAGKTTCFGVVSGLVAPDSGHVDVLGRGGFDAGRDAGRLGLLPQDAELPPHTRVEIYLRYLARLQGAGRVEAARQTDRILDALSLRDRRRSRIAELSHGMRRRVAVGQALLGAPALILLDEPTSGLDPELAAQMRELLIAERARGASLLVSSHVLTELEAVCDHVVFMQRGRATRSGTLADVTDRARVASFTLARPPSLERLRAHVAELRAHYEGATLRVAIPLSADPADYNARVLAALLQLDAGVLELRAGESLERTYLAQDPKKN